MKTPALTLLVAYAFGAGFGRWLGEDLLAWVVGSACVAACLCWARGWRRAIICLALFLAGFLNMVVRTSPLSEDDLRFVAPAGDALAQVRGTLRHTPRQNAFLRDEALVIRYLVEMDAREVRFGPGEWRPVCGRVLLTTPDLPEKVFRGQPVEVAGVLGPPPHAAAEGLFDYADYLALRGVHFRLRCTSPHEITLLGANIGPGFADHFLSWARSVLTRGLDEKDQAVHLLWSMTLGVQEELPAEAFQPFMMAGTLHVFAISGLHVALIGWVVLQGLGLCRVPRPAAAAGMIALLWAYTAATGWQPSAIRATLMTTVFALGGILRRPTNILNSLYSAALLLLLFDPRQMFGASFQLSFFVVFTLAILLPTLELQRDQRVHWLVAKDDLLPESLLPPWKRVAIVVLRPAYSLLAGTVIATLGSAPLTAHYFHQVSIGALLANFFVVPLSSLALAANVASLTFALTPLCVPLNNAAWVLMRGMSACSESVANVPYGSWRVAALPWPAILLFYFALIIYGSFKGWRLRRLALSALALSSVLWGACAWVSSATSHKLTVLATDGGLSIFADAPGRQQDFLVDTGNADSAERLTIPFLKAQGVNSLKSMVLTHGDVRHVGGALATHAAFRTDEIITSSLRFRSAPYRNVISTLESTPGLLRQAHEGDKIGRWTVLHPCTKDKFARADDAAFVLKADFGGARVLIASDLGGEGQRRLLEKHTGDLQAEILISGLAADGTALGEPFLDAVSPRLVILGDSREAHQRQALRSLKARLNSRGIVIWRMEECDSVTLELCHAGWEARNMTKGRLCGVPERDNSPTPVSVKTPAPLPGDE